jgi:hypothetical protein
MHWIGWYSAMVLNRLAGGCGHFWDARYYVTAIAPNDHRRVLNTLRYIHANPRAAGVHKGFYDPCSSYGPYCKLEADGLSAPGFRKVVTPLISTSWGLRT